MALVKRRDGLADLKADDASGSAPGKAEERHIQDPSAPLARVAEEQSAIGAPDGEAAVGRDDAGAVLHPDEHGGIRDLRA